MGDKNLFYELSEEERQEFFDLLLKNETNPQIPDKFVKHYLKELVKSRYYARIAEVIYSFNISNSMKREAWKSYIDVISKYDESIVFLLKLSYSSFLDEEVKEYAYKRYVDYKNNYLKSETSNKIKITKHDDEFWFKRFMLFNTIITSSKDEEEHITSWKELINLHIKKRRENWIFEDFLTPFPIPEEIQKYLVEYVVDSFFERSELFLISDLVSLALKKKFEKKHTDLLINKVNNYIEEVIKQNLHNPSSETRNKLSIISSMPIQVDIRKRALFSLISLYLEHPKLSSICNSSNRIRAVSELLSWVEDVSLRKEILDFLKLKMGIETSLNKDKGILLPAKLKRPSKPVDKKHKKRGLTKT